MTPQKPSNLIIESAVQDQILPESKLNEIEAKIRAEINREYAAKMADMEREKNDLISTYEQLARL